MNMFVPGPFTPTCAAPKSASNVAWVFEPALSDHELFAERAKALRALYALQIRRENGWGVRLVNWMTPKASRPPVNIGRRA